jgi:hypothetical protein
VNTLAVPTLRGIELCRRYLARHPFDPVKAVNEGYDFADATSSVRTARPPRAVTRWVELRPDGLGIAVVVVYGPDRRVRRPYLPYPVAGGRDGTVLDLDAIVSVSYLDRLTRAAGRALEHLESTAGEHP